MASAPLLPLYFPRTEIGLRKARGITAVVELPGLLHLLGLPGGAEGLDGQAALSPTHGGFD